MKSKRKIVFLDVGVFAKYAFQHLGECLLNYFADHTEDRCLFMTLYCAKRCYEETWIDSSDLSDNYTIRDWIGIEDTHTDVSVNDEGKPVYMHHGDPIIHMILAENDDNPDKWLIDIIFRRIGYGYQLSFWEDGIDAFKHTMTSNTDENPLEEWNTNPLLCEVVELVKKEIDQLSGKRIMAKWTGEYGNDEEE